MKKEPLEGAQILRVCVAVCCSDVEEEITACATLVHLGNGDGKVG